VGGDQVVHGKPEPDIFLAAARLLGRAPSECVVLEDSEPGVVGAAAAGMRPILIPDRREPSVTARQTAHVVVESLAEASLVIDRMMAGPPR
jgi:beta-phosphoglucomutase-like phosphatase (HAD superfamily)